MDDVDEPPAPSARRARRRSAGGAPAQLPLPREAGKALRAYADAATQIGSREWVRTGIGWMAKQATEFFGAEGVAEVEDAFGVWGGEFLGDEIVRQDLAVAVDTAHFATPGVHIGLFCSTPMVALSRNVGRKQAMEMLILGDPCPAEKALEIGLVNRVVGEDALDVTVQEMTDKILDKSGYTIKVGKEAFYKQLESSVEEAYAYTAKVMAENMMSHDAQEGVGAFVEKRKPVWRGK